MVEALEPVREGGFNTYVGLSDEVGDYADLYEDGYELALADQPGIEDVEHADREDVYVRTCLSLPDVHAAAIRALLDINRRPRQVPELGLPLQVLAELAQGITASLAEQGFSPGPDPVIGRKRQSAHQFRRIRNGLIQVVNLTRGIGETSDGTKLDRCVGVTLVVFDPAEPADLARIAEGGGLRGAPVTSIQRYVPDATVTVLDRRLTEDFLPWFATVDTRAAIVHGWLREPNQPYGALWEKADTAARWGLREEASALLRFGHRKQRQHGPKFAAVAAKHRLPY